ncbi:hypothetical protein Tco_0138168 [Tanacetum coccineum]
MSIQDMEDLKQQYLYKMKSLINEFPIKDYRDEKIDIKINELKENFNGMSIEINKKKKLQQLEQVANLSTHPSRFFNSFCYDDDDDDDEEYTIAITPVLPTEKPDNSLSMGDEHLSTIPETESDELIKSSVENLVPIPSESEDECECDVPDCDDSQTTNFSTFSNPLFDDSTSSDDESSHEEVIHEISFKTYSNPLFDLDEEIISSEFNPIHNEDLDSTPKNDRFDTESYLLESLLNRDTLMASSPKIDTLLDEFTGELIKIPLRIVNREHEEYISLLKRLLYDNSSPRPPEDFHANPNMIIESLPTFPIPVEDSDSLREEIDIFPGLDDSIPPGIESDDYDSEGDNNSISLPEFESFHVDYPDSGDSTINVVEDIPVNVPNILPTHPTLHMDFDFIPSHNDIESDLDVSSPSGDRNKIYDPGICIEVESTRFLATISPVIDTLLTFSFKNEDKVFNHGVLASKEICSVSPFLSSLTNSSMGDRVKLSDSLIIKRFVGGNPCYLIFIVDCLDFYTMADVNVNAPAEQAPAMAPPTRTDDQILPRSRWVPVGKSNCYLDVEKSQNNPIYKITVDILKHTNFFRAFIASSTIPSIYIQQFWDTVRYDKTTGSYSCQLDEQWLDLTKDTLRDALQITPVDNNNAFSSPPTPDVLIKFVNDLGYPKAVRTLSDVVTNDMFQPWRALTTIINLCLTGKTSGFERPRAPVLQILWGVVNQAHIDYAERMWEEFTQSIHTFIEDKKNLARHTQGRKKANLIVIPSVRFTKLIIHHLQSKHKFHPRPGSPLHLPNEESVLGYLKFSAKGTKREVFGMPIPNNLITDDIQGEQYYNAYLEKVAKHQGYLASEEVSDPDSPAPKPAKATKPNATKQSKPLAPKATPVTKPAAAEALKPTASQPLKPTPATTEPSKKDQSKKRKLVKEFS